jgi:hypothetical protein
MLVILGSTGITGVLGSVSHLNVFHPPGWVNWLHLCFGVLVLAVARSSSRKFQMGLALLGALAGTALGVADLAVQYKSAGTPDVSDPVAHLVVGMMGIWALYNTAKRPSA